MYDPIYNISSIEDLKETEESSNFWWEKRWTDMRMETKVEDNKRYYRFGKGIGFLEIFIPKENNKIFVEQLRQVTVYDNPFVYVEANSFQECHRLLVEASIKFWEQHDYGYDSEWTLDSYFSGQ